MVKSEVAVKSKVSIEEELRFVKKKKLWWVGCGFLIGCVYGFICEVELIEGVCMYLCVLYL